MQAVGRESDEEVPPAMCDMDAPCSANGKFDVANGIFPECIVWCWIAGCTQCTGGLVGHMGITNSRGEVWELVGLGAERNHGQLAFGPIVRYIPLSPKLIGRGTCDEGIERAISKYRNQSCSPLNNCHCFVAACLSEMKFLGIPCWGAIWPLLAVMIWVCGIFPLRWQSAACLLSTAVAMAAVVCLFIFLR
ncbi:unnamed protein product [Durusdinium trenchii]|uniref:Uncharacterized protein n=1 Tax=Durusdinium trenchii TaxID=1381693 RepID=A0ABP0MUT4_9DINO